ncbi:MAG: class I SAM-dependent methyltransferase [Deltaproteobacteria bacterium]
MNENTGGRGYWNRLKAEWYRKGLKHSTLPNIAVPFMLEKAKGARTFLDVGAGCGALSIPLAKAGKSVTALDRSPAMIGLLEEDAKKLGLRNIKTITGAWGEVHPPSRDALLCANVPELLKVPQPFLAAANGLARKFVFIIEKADPKSDKFYYKELYPLLFNRPFEVRGDYITTYNALHGMGIFANVEIIDYDFDQPFDDLEEAVSFWKEYLGVVTEEHDKRLKDFLGKKLVKAKNGLLAKFHKKSAIIWWKKA